MVTSPPPQGQAVSPKVFPELTRYGNPDPKWLPIPDFPGWYTYTLPGWGRVECFVEWVYPTETAMQAARRAAKVAT